MKTRGAWPAAVRNEALTLSIEICESMYMNAEAEDGIERRQAADLLRALAHPVRMEIVEILADGPQCVHELVDALGVGQPLVSQHLRVLRSARVLSAKRRGKEILYSLTDRHVAHIVGDAITHMTEY